MFKLFLFFGKSVFKTKATIFLKLNSTKAKKYKHICCIKYNFKITFKMYLYKIRTYLLRDILEKIINGGIIRERRLQDSSVYKLEAYNLTIKEPPPPPLIIYPAAISKRLHPDSVCIWGRFIY